MICLSLVTAAFSLPLEEQDLYEISPQNGKSEGVDTSGSLQIASQEEWALAEPYLEKQINFKVYQIKQVKECIADMKAAGIDGQWLDVIWRAALHGDQNHYDGLLQDLSKNNFELTGGAKNK